MEPMVLTSPQHSGISQPVPDARLTATTTGNHGDVKPYFDTLPRELRDCVYDLLYQEIEESMREIADDLEFYTRAIIPKLRLVSRQFKIEYDERISVSDVNQQLTVTDFMDCFDQQRPKILCSPLSTHATCLTINVAADFLCSHVIDAVCVDGGFVTDWLANFTQQLPHLRKLRLRVCVPILHSAKVVLCITQIPGEEFHFSTELQVLSCDDMTYAARPLGTWSKESGMQRHDDAIAKHEARHRMIREIVLQERSRE